MIQEAVTNLALSSAKAKSKTDSKNRKLSYDKFKMQKAHLELQQQKQAYRQQKLDFEKRKFEIKQGGKNGKANND